MKAVLYSIKPKYVSQILCGAKKFEFRKTIFSDQQVKKMLIYSSYPIQRVVAECDILGVLNGMPMDIWEKTHESSGVTEEEFFSYFARSTIAYALQIDNVLVYESPKQLGEYGLKDAPQSFVYVDC